MDFSLTDEQSMLADSVARFVDNDYDFETRQKIAGSDLGYSTAMWRTFAGLGWTALPFAENDGGLGGGPVELMLLMQQFGRGLIVEPFLPTVVLAGGILRRAASGEQKQRWLTPLIGGELQAALAFAEPQGRFNPADIATTATADGDGYRLTGSKAFVLNGGTAELLIIPARTAGARTDRDGITLFAISRDTHEPGGTSGDKFGDTHKVRSGDESDESEDTHGILSGARGGAAGDSDEIIRDTHESRDTHRLERRGYPVVDGHRAAEIRLQDVRVEKDAIIGGVGAGYPALQAAIDEATLAVCAEAVGIIRELHEKTVDYSKSRIQFGVPIGSFQALQHRMVDMLMACEQCQSLLYWATMLANSNSVDTISAVSALKYQIGTSGRAVAQEAVQIHGGMGVTWELDIAHFFKRFSVIETLFGNADFHLDRYIASSRATD